MEQLIEHLKKNGLSQAAFAATVGITQSSLSKMCSGVIQPSLETAVLIQRMTNGDVPASCWIPEPEPAPVEKVAGA